MTDATPKQLVDRALRGEPRSRAVAGPLAVHYCARLAGVSMREYTLNPRTLAECVLRYHETFRPDAVWLSADTWVTAEAMGAPVAFPFGDQPMSGTGRPSVVVPSDIDRIPPPRPDAQGRQPIMLEALRRLRDALGDDVFLVACFDQYPFSLACALMGMERVMTLLLDDRPMVEALMARCAEYTVAYATALAEAGADMLSGGDSPAGLIGPRAYREAAAPFERQVVGRLKQRVSVPISLHICGDATPLLADMADTGADVLEIDHQVDLASACQALGPSTALWGNLDPVGLLVQGSPEQVRRATLELIETAAACRRERFVVSSGCTLAPDTPPENLHAMLDTVRRHRDTCN